MEPRRGITTTLCLFGFGVMIAMCVSHYLRLMHGENTKQRCQQGRPSSFVSHFVTTLHCTCVTFISMFWCVHTYFQKNADFSLTMLGTNIYVIKLYETFVLCFSVITFNFLFDNLLNVYSVHSQQMPCDTKHIFTGQCK